MKYQINTIREGIKSALEAEVFVDKPVRRALLDAVKAAAQLEAMVGEPVAWLHPANSSCVTTDPTAYARGIPLYRAAPPAQQPQYDQTALELCAVCGWKTLIPGDCCLNCERNKAQQPQAEAGRINYFPVYEFAHKHKLLYNEVCAVVCAAMSAPQQDEAVPVAVVKYQVGGLVVHIVGDVQEGDELFKTPQQAEAVPSDVVRDAERWRMLPAYFYEYQIDAMKLYRDIDAAIAQQKGGV